MSPDCQGNETGGMFDWTALVLIVCMVQTWEGDVHGCSCVCAGEQTAVACAVQT
jgi:hypothetical protein